MLRFGDTDSSHSKTTGTILTGQFILNVELHKCMLEGTEDTKGYRAK